MSPLRTPWLSPNISQPSTTCVLGILSRLETLSTKDMAETLQLKAINEESTGQNDLLQTASLALSLTHFSFKVRASSLPTPVHPDFVIVDVKFEIRTSIKNKNAGTYLFMLTVVVQQNWRGSTYAGQIRTISKHPLYTYCVFMVFVSWLQNRTWMGVSKRPT